MMKLVDVPDSKSGVPWDVWVRVPLSAQKMINKSNILGIFFIVFLGILVPWKMISTVFSEMTPDGKYENYKEYISESVKIWVKNRDNQFYDKQNIINWYESSDKDGKRPRDLFPPIIYATIKDAINLTFGEYAHIKDPDKIKKIIEDDIESKKQEIVKQLDERVN